MEVFVAILLLFGVLSLGSASSDDAGDDPTVLEIPVTTYERQDLQGKDVEHTQSQDCLADPHFVIYRDLTVPYENEIKTETTGASDSEKVYPDE